jgi:hypothetical protein
VENKLIWRIAAILLGVLLLLPAYFWAQYAPKPGGENFLFPLAAVLGGAAANLLIVAVLFVIAGGVGRAALHRLDLTALARSERIALECLLGLGSVSSAALLLGLAGVFTLPTLWLPLIVVGVLLRRFVGGWLADWRLMLGGLRLENGWTRWLALLVVLLLGLALLRAVAPPTAWDSLTYHLVAPARYLAEGRIGAHADNHFLGFPQLVEVLFGVAMSPLGRGEAGALVHYGFGLLGLLATAGLVRRAAGGEAGWLAVALLLSALSLWLLFGWAYVDLAVLAYGAAALVVVERWRGTGGLGWVILLGVVAGLAFSVKYTAAALGIALALTLIVNQPRQALRWLVIFGISAFVACLPWLIKGTLLYGNPVYPFLFDGLNWDTDRAATFSTFGRGLLASGDGWQIPLLPLMATIFGVERGSGFAFSAGVWLLSAPLLLLPGWSFLTTHERKLARDGLLLAAPLLLFWMLLAATSEIGAQTRLMAMLFPAAALMGALGFAALWRFPEKPLQIAFIVRAALVGALALSAIEAGRELVRDRTLPYLFALESRNSYLDAKLGAHINALRALESLPDGAQVLLLWEPRSYYCPSQVTCQPDILFDHWARPLRLGAAPAEVFDGWRAAGVTHLLLWSAGYEAEINNPNSRFAVENALFPAVLAAEAREVWTDGVRYTLYALGG